MPKSFLQFFSIALLCLTASNAQAVTINGNSYDELISFDLNRDGLRSNRHIGYWRGMKKFYTYDKPGVTVTDSALAGNDGSAFDSFYLEGMTATATESSALASAKFTFFGDDGSTLLTGSYVNAGEFDLKRGTGVNGNFDVTGLFSITGGSLQALFGTTVYAEFLFDYYSSNGSKDYYGNFGQVHLYGTNGGEEPPDTEVPEPASMVLLVSGLIGLRKRLHTSSTRG